MRRIFITVYLLLLVLAVNKTAAQTGTRLKPAMFQVSFDDDYFNYRLCGTDKYYTAGLEFSIFFKNKTGDQHIKTSSGGYADLHYVSIKQMMNTPNEISRKGYQPGDYPYAGLLFATYGRIHSGHDSRFTTALSIGLLGPKAFAGETQTWVHSLIHYTKPAGWDSQINGELMVNYMTRYERALLQKSKRLDVLAGSEFNAGTIFTNASAGIQLRFGKLNNLFSNYGLINLSDEAVVAKSFFFFLYPSVTFVGYNAALQGGISRKQQHTAKHQYVIADEAINRLLGRICFGITWQGRRMTATFYQVIQSAEFSTVHHHEYGNITLSFHL
jgi:hypothetical protein